MAKAGRPSKIDKVFTNNKRQFEMLLKAGWTDKQVAEFYGITEQTINNWKKQHLEFFESLKDWKRMADDKVERSLYERATGYSHPEVKVFCNAAGEVTEVNVTRHYPPDTAAAFIWLKNRQPLTWRDRQQIEHGFAPDAIKTILDTLDPETRARVIAGLKAKMEKGK